MGGRGKMKLLAIFLLIILLGGTMNGCKASVEIEDSQPDDVISDNQTKEEVLEKPYFDEWIDYTAEELQDIFWKHEEAFDYIAQFILSLYYTDFYIVVDAYEKTELMFYTENPVGLFNSDDPAAIYDYTDGANVGYVSDDLFEQYVNEILVGEKFSRIYVSKGSWPINFGHAWPIYYSEEQEAYGVSEDPELWGDLKENWFYYIQSYV